MYERMRAPTTHFPAVNTAAVVTLAADATGRAHVIRKIVASYNAAPTGGRLLITDGGATVFDVDLPALGKHEVLFEGGFEFKPNSQVVVTLAAGGAACTGKLDVFNAKA